MNNQNKQRIDELFATQTISKEDLRELIATRNPETAEYLFAKARIRQEESYGKQVFIRGIIEFSNYCKSNCHYCGIQRDNKNADRYRLSEEVILACCRHGYECGFRTFVLQSGEDLYYTDEMICHIIQSIKKEMNDCAITLSIGEKSREQYQMYYDAGADRYLLRHETASLRLYRHLHPSDQTMENRQRCLKDLKEIGYQTGAGMMIQAPSQTIDDLVEDFFYMKELQPDMIGMGPFIPHKDTQFRDEKAGSEELTLFCLGLVRLMFPHVLLPATTALGSIDSFGREKGILAGANVIMPNLSPKDVRGKYLLYNGKLNTQVDIQEYNQQLAKRMHEIGYQIVVGRGDAYGKGPHF